MKIVLNILRRLYQKLILAMIHLDDVIEHHENNIRWNKRNIETLNPEFKGYDSLVSRNKNEIKNSQKVIDRMNRLKNPSTLSKIKNWIKP